MILDVICCYLLLFLLYINIEIGKNKNVRLAGDHLCMGNGAGDVFDGVFLCCPFSHKMSWMGSWT